jgi:hypothetical protein
MFKGPAPFEAKDGFVLAYNIFFGQKKRKEPG